MEERIYDLITYIAPIAAGFITSTLLPAIISKISVKFIKKKVNEVNSGKQLEDINKKLKLIEKEILEMRGKVK